MPSSGVSSALSGAGAGAGIGTAIMPGVGTVIGAGVGALAGGLGDLIGTSYKRKRQKKLNADLEAMEQGNLGLSEAQKKQQVDMATRAAGEQSATLQQGAARDALASGGARDMGGYQQAIAGTGANIAKTAAGASANAQSMSERQAQMRRQEILAQLDSVAMAEQLDTPGNEAQAQAAGKAIQPLFDQYGPDLLKILQGDALGKGSING